MKSGPPHAAAWCAAWLQGGRRRTIVPAKVESLDINPLFHLPPAAKQPGPTPAEPPAKQPAEPPPQQAPRQPPPQQQQAPPPGQQQQQAPPPQSPAAAATLPMSPPPIAVRLPAPGAAVAASLLLRGGGGGGASPGAAGSPGGEGGTPKRITPVRMLQPAEVQPTFLHTVPATSPRSARRDMLQQPDFVQARSRPGSRLGTPLAGPLAAAAASPFALGAAVAAAASAAGPSSGGGGSGGGASSSGGPSSSSRSPLLWSVEEKQAVCQQLSFDTLLSPVKDTASSAAPQPDAAALPAAADGQTAAADAGPALAARQQQPLDAQLQQLDISSSACSGGGPSAGSRRQRILDAAMQRVGDRLAPAGGSTSDGFDAPSTSGLPASVLRPLQLSGTAASKAPSGPGPDQAGVHRQQQEQQQPAQQPQQDTAQLCSRGRLLAELHAALLRCCSGISLSGGRRAR